MKKALYELRLKRHTTEKCGAFVGKNIDNDITREDLFDSIDIIYKRYDFNFFDNLEIESLIKSCYYKFIQLNLIIEDLKCNSKTEFIITAYTLFELIYQAKFLKLNKIYSLIIDNYFRLMEDNVFFYDDDLLNFIEIDVLKNNDEFKEYLHTNNKMYRNSDYSNESIDSFSDDIEDDFSIISYYLLVNDIDLFKSVFNNINGVELTDIKSIMNNIQKEEMNIIVSKITNTTLFWELI